MTLEDFRVQAIQVRNLAALGFRGVILKVCEGVGCTEGFRFGVGCFRALVVSDCTQALNPGSQECRRYSAGRLDTFSNLNPIDPEQLPFRKSESLFEIPCMTSAVEDWRNDLAEMNRLWAGHPPPPHPCIKM